MTTDAMDEQSPGKTLSSSEDVYRRLRENVILGTWEPGQKLKPQHLKSELGCTSGMLREALIRLAGEGLVSMEGQRGFRTLISNRKALREVTELRLLIETEGARLSIAHGDLEWEANLNAAHHRLAYVEERMRNDGDVGGSIRIWSSYEWDFHRLLIAASESEAMKILHRQLFDRFRLHMLAQSTGYGFLGDVTIREHRAILETAIRRDADGCARALENHYRVHLRDRVAKAAE